MSAGRGGQVAPGGPGTRNLWLWTHSFLAVTTVLSMVNRGYHFGKEDQCLYLPFVLHWNHPELFHNDYLLKLTYPRQSVTWVTLAFLARWFDLKALCLMFWVLCSYLVILLTYKTALLWWKDKRAAVLAVLLWTPTYLVPGVGNFTFDDYFTTRIIGTVFCMAALYAFLRGRPAAAGVFSFGGGLVHIISCAPMVAGVGLSALVVRKWKAIGWVMGGGVAAALLIATFGGGGTAASPFERYSGNWLKAVLKADGELFPHRWPSTVWWALASYIVAFFGLVLWRYARRMGHEAIESRVLWVNAGIVASSVVGWVGSVLGLVIIIEFCLFRGYLLFMWLLAIYLAGLLVPMIWSGRMGPILAGAWAAGSFVGADPVLVMSTPLAVIVGDTWPWIDGWWRSHVRGLQKLAVATALVAIALWWEDFCFYVLGWNAEQWRLGNAGLLRAATFALTLGAVAGAWRLAGRRLPALMPLGAILMALVIAPGPGVIWWLQSSRQIRRLYGPRISSAVVHALAEKRRLAWEGEMGKLVKAAVPADSVVLVPPGWAKFRIDAHRSSFVTFKDGAPSEFSPSYAREWATRLAEINARWTIFSRYPDTDLNDAELTKLVERWRGLPLGYLVSEKPHEFPILGRAGPMILYLLPPTGGASPGRP